MELEDGRGVATEPDRGNTFSRSVGWLMAFTGATSVVVAVGGALLACCTQQRHNSCRCEGFPWVVAVELGSGCSKSEEGGLRHRR